MEKSQLVLMVIIAIFIVILLSLLMGMWGPFKSELKTFLKIFSL